MIFDTHAHYDSIQFEEDREVLLSSMEKNGIGAIVNVCAGVSELDKTTRLTEQYPFVYGAAGVHPDDAALVTEEVLEKVRRMSRLPKFAAIGEIGLDYYWHKEKEEQLIQQKVFREFLQLAKEEKLPFMVHSREAAQDTLSIVKEYVRKGMYGGIIHCFSYEKEIAREYVKMGLFLGIGGVITFKNGRKLSEVVAEVPLTSLVLETDCPYLAPEPFRGKRNSSLYLPYVAEAIARIKGVTAEEVISVTEQNARELLRLQYSSSS